MLKPGNWFMAVLIVIGGALLSIPFYTDHTFWAETQGAWVAHVALGCTLGLGVSAMFIKAVSTLIYNEAECCKTIEERQKPILFTDDVN